MGIRSYFTEENKLEITNAIRVAETNTSGEIRVHIEKHCKENVLDRAAYIFEKLEMHKTKLRNGVLFYVALEDQKFAILGDAGINQKVPDNFWDEIKELVIGKFKEKMYTSWPFRRNSKSRRTAKNSFPVPKR